MAVRRTRSDVVFDTVNTLLLSGFLMVLLYPLLYIVSSSFSDAGAVAAGKVWLWPVDFSLAGYETVFHYNTIWIGYRNSILYTVAGTAVNVVVTILAAYPLSRSDLKGNSLIMFFLAFTLLFSGGLIPTYILISKLHMIDTVWAMIVPGALSVWNVFITRAYYQSTIAKDMLNAARMDGCDDFTFLLKVVLPLSGAITAVNVLFYAVANWNAFMDPFLYLNDPALQPLQMVLRNILIINEIDTTRMVNVQLDQERQYLRELLKYSVIVVASIPMLILYPFVQRHFVKGVMIGGIKG